MGTIIKAPFSIAITLRCSEGCYSFPWNTLWIYHIIFQVIFEFVYNLLYCLTELVFTVICWNSINFCFFVSTFILALLLFVLHKFKSTLKMYVFIQPLCCKQDVTQGHFLSEVKLVLNSVFLFLDWLPFPRLKNPDYSYLPIAEGKRWLI